MKDDGWRALASLRPGSSIIAVPGSGTPDALLCALRDVAQACPGHILHGGLLLGELPFLPALSEGSLRYRTWHVSPAARPAAKQGLLEYVPMRSSVVAGSFARGFDAALVRVSKPDRRGRVSLGPSLTYSREALAAARMVIAEVDPAIPWTNGDTKVELSDIDVLVDAESDMCTYDPAPVSSVAADIARNVAELVGRPSVLQLGIGAIPEAVASVLPDEIFRQVSFVGMVTEQMLARSVPAQSSPRFRAVELMGGPALMAMAGGNPAVQMVPSAYAHNPLRLASEGPLTSINSALAIDLQGQAACEGVGGRIVGGIGGSVDFFEAARSSGGDRIIALRSKNDAGHSNIVSTLPRGTPVTIPSHLMDIVVTEFGAVRLTGCSQEERTELLVSIAAPEHRSALTQR